MGLDRSLVGVPSEPQLRSWDSKDALLYAVGVGAGLGSPLEELEFTTENCEGIEQKVLPTFGVLIAQARAGRSLGDFNRAMLVHAEQFFELHRPLPVTGTVRTVSTVTGIYDKGSGALIYRLSGDRNPLHVDPKFAARGGFSQPILHGLCTYGVTGRALLHALCGSDPARFRSMSGRFSHPVLPGESLTVSMWRQRGSDTAAFQTTREDGVVVIDRGLFQGG